MEQFVRKLRISSLNFCVLNLFSINYTESSWWCQCKEMPYEGGGDKIPKDDRGK